jgi:hypothetical protein
MSVAQKHKTALAVQHATRQLALSVRRDAWQDTPFVKAPYTAAVTVPSPLTTVVMSAQNVGNATNADGSVTFRSAPAGPRLRRPGRVGTAGPRCASRAALQRLMRRACNAGCCVLNCSFHQPVPLVSYLIVLTAGVIEYSAIDARTGVWAEPSLSGAVGAHGCCAAWDIMLRGIP